MKGTAMACARKASPAMQRNSCGFCMVCSQNWLVRMDAWPKPRQQCDALRSNGTGACLHHNQILWPYDAAFRLPCPRVPFTAWTLSSGISSQSGI